MTLWRNFFLDNDCLWAQNCLIVGLFMFLIDMVLLFNYIFPYCSTSLFIAELFKVYAIVVLHTIFSFTLFPTFCCPNRITAIIKAQIVGLMCLTFYTLSLTLCRCSFVKLCYIVESISSWEWLPLIIWGLEHLMCGWVCGVGFWFLCHVPVCTYVFAFCFGLFFFPLRHVNRYTMV